MAFLIDGAAYFSAFVKVVSKARRSILIVGWDIDSRLELLPGETSSHGPTKLGEFLDWVVSQTPDLHAHILEWDFAMIYAFEREPLPFFNLGWKTHRRVRFHADDEHPVGASHHQKIVVVDDEIGFAGGLDLTASRWDTPQHQPEDPRRVLPSGEAYPPFHDVHMMVEGEAAACLGQLARERWRRATGETLPAPDGRENDLWPDDLDSDLENVEVAIARTEAAYKDQPEVQEIETLYKDAIASAKNWIYIENQYFTSLDIEEALANRLNEDTGPEVVLVLPHQCEGWLEEQTMNNIRSVLLKKLWESDRHNRLRVYYPSTSANEKEAIFVHAKVLIVDDELVRIGSSNLSNRSMGLDSECDLAIEARGSRELKEAIRVFRSRLLGEHLSVAPEEIAETVSEQTSLIKAIEKLQSNSRSLYSLQTEPTEWFDHLDEDELLTLDPEQPLELDRMIDIIIHKDGKGQKRWKVRFIKTGLIILLLAGLAALWRFTPPGQSIDKELLVQWANSIREEPAAVGYVIAAYLTGSLLFFPATLLIGATAFVFDPISGFLYALCGSLVSALATYGIGRGLGRATVRRLAGDKLNRLSKRLAQRGLTAVMVVHLVPIAQFTVVNMVAGASYIRFRDFALGTLLGMAPGILAVTVFVDRLKSALLDPNWTNVLWLLAVLVIVVSSGVWIGKRFTR